MIRYRIVEANRRLHGVAPYHLARVSPASLLAIERGSTLSSRLEVVVQPRIQLVSAISPCLGYGLQVQFSPIPSIEQQVGFPLLTG